MTLGERLRHLRKSHGLTLQGVGSWFGITRASVSGWESDRARPDPEKLPLLAKKLGVSVEYLITGKGQGDLASSNVEPGPEIKGLVPVISWVQAGDFCEAVDLLPPGEAEEWISCPVSHSPHTYALRVRGASMEPRFREGEIVIVDPKIGADNGRFVIAKKTGANEVTLKKLVIEGDDRYLQAVNPAWPEPIIRIAEEWIICGVVICKMEML